MAKKAYRIAPEIKEQIINRIKNDGISVAEAAKAHGVSTVTIRYASLKVIHIFLSARSVVWLLGV